MRKFDCKILIPVLRAGSDRLATAFAGPLMARGIDIGPAFLAITLFYWPMLRSGGRDAGLLYTGDVLGFYLPATLKTVGLFSQNIFTGINYSLFNGSSDFFLSPNFFTVHPMLVGFGLLTPLDAITASSAGFYLVLMLAVHSALAFYFAQRLSTQYLGLTSAQGIFVGAGYSTSVYMINSLTQPPFLLSAAVIPWVIWSSIRFAGRPGLSTGFIAALAVIFCLSGGYLPLALGSLLLGAAFIALIQFGLKREDISLADRTWATIKAFVPVAVGVIVISPYVLELVRFHAETSSASRPNLFYSAHQLSEVPSGILRLLSTHVSSNKPFYEFTVIWGFVALFAVIIFLMSKEVKQELSSRDWRLFGFCWVLYVLTVLAIYGDFSPISDMVHYFVPGVGDMHIYQRFLLAAQLVFVIALAIIIRSIARHRDLLVTRVLIGASIVLCAWLLVAESGSIWDGAIGSVGREFLLIELFYGILFLTALGFPDERFALLAATTFFCLPSLNQIYDLAHGGNTYEAQVTRQPMVLDNAVRHGIIGFMQANAHGKEYLKYLDITPMWAADGYETFVKDYPHFLLRDINLSSFGGFTFYLSARQQYLKRMPIGPEIAVLPDWQLAEDAGVDFIVGRKGDMSREPVAGMIEPSNGSNWLTLPRDVVIAPVRQPLSTDAGVASRTLFDNGFFKVVPAGTFDDPYENLCGKACSATQSSDGGGGAQLAIDGNHVGDFAKGSVSHTGAGASSWLDVDIGSVSTIDAVRIWNRTDCCGERLRDYWIFISDTPFDPKATAEQLRTLRKVWSKQGVPVGESRIFRTGGVNGRYVRIQFATSAASDRFLSLAEMEVLRTRADIGGAPAAETAFKVEKFETNLANHTRFSFTNDQPVQMLYQFSPNPRQRFLMDGERPKIRMLNGLQLIDVKPGSHVLELTYTNRLLQLFWLSYALFFGGGAVLFLTAAWRRGRKYWERSGMSRQVQVNN